MGEQDEQRLAAEALAQVRTHQEKVDRATRVPLWLYAAMFVLSAGVTAANDFVDMTGTKVIAALVLVALVVVFAATFATGTSALSKVRGVQARQSFVPRVFGIVVFVAAGATWLISRYGAGFATGVARSLGLDGYPNTVAGVIYGAAFTVLFALSQLLTTVYRRRVAR